MKIEIQDKPTYIQYIKAIFKNYIKIIEENNKLIKNYKKNILEKIKKKEFSEVNLKHNLKNNENTEHLINLIFKNTNIKKFYCNDRIKDIIFNSFAKRVNEKGNLNFKDKDFERIKKNIIKNISKIKIKKYAFLIEHCKLKIPTQKFGNCQLVEWDFEKTPVYASDLFKLLIPAPIPDYKNFLIITLYGNDPKIDYPKALKLASNFVGLLKLQNPKSSKIALSGTYFVLLKDKWYAAYKSKEVISWDLDIGSDKIKQQIKPFLKYLNNNEANELHESFSNSLIRLSYALEIKQPDFKMAEITGCLETLLTTRSEARNNKVSKVNLIHKRILSLLGKKIDSEWLIKHLKTFYDERSSYYHQSSAKYIEKYEITIREIYLTTLVKSMPLLKKLKSKKEFFKKLDENYKKLF